MLGPRGIIGSRMAVNAAVAGRALLLGARSLVDLNALPREVLAPAAGDGPGDDDSPR
ncbi:MAG: hypothetical protein ACYC91_01870 [Solirubrobacteraceae bacterium]